MLRQGLSLCFHLTAFDVLTAQLYDELNPITVVELIRFKNKIVPITFLSIMGEKENDLEVLSDSHSIMFSYLVVTLNKHIIEP